jgi:hypothetical protein
MTFRNEDPQTLDPALEERLYNQHAEVKTLDDLTTQRGTPIPALFNIFFKFIQNPSTVSIETYKRMVDTDSTAGSGMDFLTTVLAARLGSYQHPSDEITAWVNKSLTMVEGGFYESLKDLLSACWAGFSVQEQCWANTDHGFIIERLAPLPPASVLFEVDRVGRLTKDGILQYQRAWTPGLLGAGIYGSGFVGTSFPGIGRPDPLAKIGDLPFPLRTANQMQFLSIRIPVQKCIHFAFNAQGKFGSPYGRSLLRRAYNHWIMKNAFLQMLSTALDRKGTPILVVFADPNTTIIDQAKISPGQNVRGNASVGISAERAALNAFSNIHNDSVVVLPGKKGQAFEVDPVQVQANTAEFIQAIDNCDKGILRAMLVPSLIFSGGDGSGSYSLGQEHSRTFEKILDGMLTGVNQVLVDQMIKRLIMYNFPESAWRKDGFGDFSKRDFSQDEVNKIIEGYSILQNMGAIDMTELEDLNKVRELAGFSLRKEVITPLQDMIRDRWSDPNGGGDGGNFPDDKAQAQEDQNEQEKAFPDPKAPQGQDNKAQGQGGQEKEKPQGLASKVASKIKRTFASKE